MQEAVREESCMRVLEKLSDFVSKWMALIVILVAALSLFFRQQSLLLRRRGSILYSVSSCSAWGLL